MIKVTRKRLPYNPSDSDLPHCLLKAEEFCNSLDTNWKTTMTMADSNASSSRSYARGYPTKEEALLMAGWTCAMGTAACDMAYCAYSFCELPDGTMGTYGQCKGWDPVKGMPL